jgi:ribosomal protein S18 acetylase RimI-like enzyme
VSVVRFRPGPPRNTKTTFGWFFIALCETIVMNIDEYRIATAKDVSELVSLINTAYRPNGAEAGWTHESELIEGERINSQQLAELLEREGSTVLLGLSKAEIVACVNVNEEAGASYIAMLTVKPSYQNLGLGKEMLELAEEYAENQYESSEVNVFVISERRELFDFYLRRGYEPTQVSSDYPANAGVGNPKISGLKLVLLTKQLG